MKKITVLKPAKTADAKPSNFCPWLIDDPEWPGTPRK
jgi:hypothetical protein